MLCGSLFVRSFVHFFVEGGDLVGCELGTGFRSKGPSEATKLHLDGPSRWCHKHRVGWI